MTIFVGCEAGQRYEFSAGLTGALASLDLATRNVATVGWSHGFLSQPLGRDLLVLWHLDANETFHGFYPPARFAESPRPQWAGVDRRGFYTCCPHTKPKGLISEAASGVVQAVAAVVGIPPGGLLYVTSGRYGSRPWIVHVVTTAGETRETLAAYRARVLEAEGL